MKHLQPDTLVYTIEPYSDLNQYLKDKSYRHDKEQIRKESADPQHVESAQLRMNTRKLAVSTRGLSFFATEKPRQETACSSEASSTYST